MDLETARSLLLLFCLLGGAAGTMTGFFRRELSTAMIGLAVVAISVIGLTL